MQEISSVGTVNFGDLLPVLRDEQLEWAFPTNNRMA